MSRNLYLIMARCIPNRHVTSWQNAVKAVSGEEILEDATSDWMLTSSGFSSVLIGTSVNVAMPSSRTGKQVS